MGAALDVMRAVARTLEIEAAGVTDNPLVFPDGDGCCPAATSTLNRWRSPLTSSHWCSARSATSPNGAPPCWWTRNERSARLPGARSGLNSGFMIAQVTAAALVSENKQRAHPASVDTVPDLGEPGRPRLHGHARRSAAYRHGRERRGGGGDRTSRRGSGLDFHRPMKSSAALQAAHEAVREAASGYERDHYFAPDIAAATELVRSGRLRALASDLLPSGGT